MTPDLPAPESYTRVLQRYDRDTGRLSPRIRFAAGCVNVESFKAESMSVKACGGDLAHTLFFPRLKPAFQPGVDAACDKARRYGWIEVTEEWRTYLAGGRVVAPDPVKTPPEVQAKTVALEQEPEVTPPVQSSSYTMEYLSAMPFRDLQTLAKSLGLKAGRVARADLEQSVFNQANNRG